MRRIEYGAARRTVSMAAVSNAAGISAACLAASARMDAALSSGSGTVLLTSWSTWLEFGLGLGLELGVGFGVGLGWGFGSGFGFGSWSG